VDWIRLLKVNAAQSKIDADERLQVSKYGLSSRANCVVEYNIGSALFSYISFYHVDMSVLWVRAFC
jgi:hypothetical protein